MDRLAKLHKEYADAGVQFLGIVTDVYAWTNKTGKDAADYVADLGVKYPQLGSTPALTSGLSYIPATFIYDSTGTMIAQVTGEHSRETWINIIETLMAKQ